MSATNSSSPVVSYLNGTAPVPQIFLGIVLVSVVYIAMMTSEYIYRSMTQVAKTRTALLPYTYPSDKQREIRQDPNDPVSIPVVLSDNERTGIEFSYSFFLQINESSFNDQDALLHVFHKGYNMAYPLMSPGVFLLGKTNTLRVYMNSNHTWNNYIDVENVPLKKWFHFAIVCRNNSLELYLNGNLSKKLKFDGSLPYQNFGNFFVFSQRRVEFSQTQIPSVDERGLRFQGPMNGMISRLEYFSYALSFTEINALLNKGPSAHIVGAGADNAPHYLTDAYWTTQYSSST
jgi:hypothetical protein